MGGCRVPDQDMGPLHSTSADLMIMYMAKAKSGWYRDCAACNNAPL